MLKPRNQNNRCKPRAVQPIPEARSQLCPAWCEITSRSAATGFAHNDFCSWSFSPRLIECLTDSVPRATVFNSVQFASTQNNLTCFNTKRTSPSRENKCRRQKQNHSHTFSINIFFLAQWKWQLVRFNMVSGQVTTLHKFCSGYTPLRVNLSFLFKFYRQVKGRDFFPRLLLC